MLFPEFIKQNETIGICAPSAGVGHKLDSFDLSLNALKERGYKIIETESVRADSLRSAEAEVRMREFNRLLSDPRVRTIIAATGGDYNYEMLPFLDDEIIKNDPKWICGYSDPTNILFYVTTKLDIATIYGFNAGSFDWRPLHDFQTNALDIIGGNVVEQHSYALWDSNRSWEEVKLDTPVSWDVYYPGDTTPNTHELNVSGRLIGGCTDIISKLIGTPYDCSADFLDRYSDEGIIWYLDTFAMDVTNLYLTLLQMKHSGLFSACKAVIIGRIMYPGESTDEEFIGNLARCFADTDIPFIWGADIGHTKPAMTLINGSVATLHCSGGSATLTQSLIK